MPIQYRTKSEIAYERLKADIINGELALGEPIVVSRASQRYGLSSMPIREALKRLEQDGLIEAIPNRGHRVAILNYMTHLENMLIRTILELQLVETVVGRLGAPELESLYACIDSLKRAAAEKDHQAYSEIQQDFYSLLVSYSPYKQIEKLWRVYYEKTKIYRFFLTLVPSRVNDVVNELTQLLGHIARNEPKQCRERLDFIQKENFNVFIVFLKEVVSNGDPSLPKAFFLPENEAMTPEKKEEILHNIDHISAIRNNML